MQIIDEANFKFSDGSPTPGRYGRASADPLPLSPIRETEDILLRRESRAVKDTEEYEGGEAESNGSVRIPEPQPARAEDMQSTPGSRSSLSDPQSLRSAGARAKTKLNVRATNVDDDHNLFDKRTINRTLSESLRVDHGFGKIVTRDLDASPLKKYRKSNLSKKKDSFNEDQGLIIQPKQCSFE